MIHSSIHEPSKKIQRGYPEEHAPRVHPAFESLKATLRTAVHRSVKHRDKDATCDVYTRSNILLMYYPTGTTTVQLQ